MQPYLERIEHLRSLRDRGADSQKLKRHIREDPALSPLYQTYLFLITLKDMGMAETRGVFEVVNFEDWIVSLSTCNPSIEDLADGPLLLRWCPIKENGAPLLVGQVSGHPHLREGARVQTSPLMNLQPTESWARSCNRFYNLGERDDGFLAELRKDGRLAPNAQRLDPF
ncbi:hypothetical protein SAMN05216224_10324 [Thioclava dalianensis]|nr:DUF6634 family protein [Thioclava dalianensis]SFN22355.1 hypothetical protein SAMN05216224_10324 [Thioclava dalianensis]